MPSKNVGTAAPEIASTVSTRSKIELWRTAEITPAGMPIDQLHHQGVQRQQQGGLKPAEHGAADGLAEEDRVSEIEQDHAGEPLRELDRQRLVEAELFAHAARHPRVCRYRRG